MTQNLRAVEPPDAPSMRSSHGQQVLRIQLRQRRIDIVGSHHAGDDRAVDQRVT
jgi:hypothetical protein